jgi:phosphotransferase system HPr-like phosphotransfer protein
MLTATLHLPDERKKTLLFSFPLKKIRDRFKSRITIQRGDSRPLDISIDEQLKELASNKSADLRIVFEGRDEMKAACSFVDYFNHGTGI